MSAGIDQTGFPKDNELSSWASHFAKVGVTPSLLMKSFEETPVPNLSLLYEVCKRRYEWLRVSVSTRIDTDITESWQLYSLCNYPGESLLKCKPLEEKKDVFGNTPLHYAAFSGSIEAVRKIWSQCPELADIKNSVGNSFLHSAARSNSAEMLEEAIKLDPESKEVANNNGITPLHYAAESGSLPVFEKALALCPEQKNEIAENGNTLLHFAALSGSSSVMGAALKACPQLTKINNISGMNFFHSAAESGLVDVIEMIHREFPDLVNSTDEMKRNALHFAGVSGSPAAIEAILKISPHLIKSKDEFNRNILHFVAESGSSACFEWLIKKDPLLVSQLWVKNKADEKPQDAARKNYMSPSPIRILQTLFGEALIGLASDKKPSDWMISLLTAPKFQKKLLDFLASNPGLNQEQLEKIVKRNDLSKAVIFKLNMFRHNETIKADIINKVLDKKLLVKILSDYEKMFKEAKLGTSPLYRELQEIVKRASVDNFDQSIINALSEALEKNTQKTRKTSIIDNGIVAAISATETMAVYKRNQLDFLPKQNELLAWAPHFEKVGVSLELLKKSFENLTGQPDYSQLYRACKRRADFYMTHPRTRAYIEINEPWQLYSLCGFPANSFEQIEKAAELKDEFSNNLLHYAAWSGISTAINHVLECCPELQERVSENGWNYLHFAALSGSADAIRIAYIKSPNLAESKSQAGKNILHYAALSGSSTAINEVIDLCPKLKRTVDGQGNSMLFTAALSGSVDAIDTVLEHCPEMVNSTNNNKGNLLHMAALSGSSAAIERVLKLCPDLKYSKDKDGDNLLHYAALSGSSKAIDKVLKDCPNLKYSPNNNGCYYVHYAALSGSSRAINKALNLSTILLVPEKTFTGDYLIHLAAQSGSPAAINTVLQRIPMESAYWGGRLNTLLHYVAMTGSAKCFEWVLKNQPTLSGRLWKQNQAGQTPNDVKTKMQPSARTILWLAFKEAFEGIAKSDNPPQWMKKLLVADGFQGELFRFLTSMPAFSEGVVENLIQQKKLPASILKDLDLAKELGNLKKGAQGLVLDRKLLAETLLKYESIAEMKKVQPSELYLKMKKIMVRAELSKTDEFDDSVIKTVMVAIDDSERTQASGLLDKVLVSALLNTSNIGALRPKHVQQSGIEITPDNYLMHIKKISDTVNSLTLKDDTKRIMGDTMLPGFLRLIENEDEIVKHVTEKYGVLYMLNKDLPLHTDHTEIGRPEEYRATLRRLLENVIGSFYVCQRAGQLTEWCDRLSTGYCFEGRVHDTFAWVTKFSEVKKFHDFMEKAINEYTAWSKVMRGKSENEIDHLDSALQFIMNRYNDFPCQADPQYAKESKITSEGVKSYLEEVLSYDNNPPVQKPDHDDILAKLDDYISQTTKPDTREAFYALRFAIVNAQPNQELAEIIDDWKKAQNYKGEKTHARVVEAHKNKATHFASFFNRGGKTKAEIVIDEIEKMIKAPDKIASKRKE